MPQASAIVPLKQKMLAERLNLSPATVSKSLRNHPEINPETRARVLDLAAQLGYRVPASPRGAKPRIETSTRYVGVLVAGRTQRHGDQDFSGSGFLTGMSEQAGVRGLSLVVHHFDGSSFDLLESHHQPQAMRDGSLRGLILVHHFEEQVVRRLSERWPLVTLVRQVPGARADHIDIDHLMAIDALVEHLYTLGHRRIGFVGRGDGMAYSFARFGSFSQAMARRNLEIQPSDLVNVARPTGGMDESANRVAEAVRAGVTAFVCASDWIANELFPRLASRGLRVPADLSLTGFDGVLPLPGFPRLTSVKAPFIDMGAAALARLLERIENPGLLPRQMLLASEFIQGQTTAVPAVTNH